MRVVVTWDRTREGHWESSQGDTINHVSPRGKALYALARPGAQRPEWFDTLSEAQQAIARPPRY